MRLLANLGRPGRRVRRGLALLVMSAFVLTALSGVAAAAPPEHFTESDTFVDDFLSDLCGAEITVSFTVRETIVFFGEGESESDPHQHLVSFRATITGPGGSLIEREAWRVSGSGDSFTFTGLPFRILSPDGGVLIRDAGFVTFTDDDIAVVHGPHPSLFEDFDPCPYLV